MKKILACLIVAFCALNASESSVSAISTKSIELYESPSCGCCEFWAKYMQKNGYKINSHKSWDFMQVKEKFGIKDEFMSCHTGIIEVKGKKFALEGHLPLSAIEWLIANAPKNVIGISAPGMPQGSPGMEQGEFEEYPVVVLYKDGKAENLGIFKGDKLIKSEKIK